MNNNFNKLAKQALSLAKTQEEIAAVKSTVRKAIQAKHTERYGATTVTRVLTSEGMLTFKDYL